MKLQPVILAAGKGTRMQSELPKPLFPVDGVPMLTRILATLEASQVALDPIIVVGQWTDAIQKQYGPQYQYAVQTDLTGTATAVAAALPYLDTSEAAPPVLILYADHPFLTIATIQAMAAAFASAAPTVAMGTVTVPNFNEWRQPFAAFGRIVRDSAGEMQKIVEAKNATDQELHITEVNPALYCVKAAWLTATLPRIEQNPITSEYYLTDLVELARLAGDVITGVPIPAEEALGINSVADAENAANRKGEE